MVNVAAHVSAACLLVIVILPNPSALRSFYQQ
jgi:hypothetical protein